MKVEAWGVLRRVVTSSGEDFLELFVREPPCLPETVHGATDLDVDEA